MPSVRPLAAAVLSLLVVVPLAGAVPGSTPGSPSFRPHDGVENPDGNVTVLRGGGALYGSIDNATAFRRASTEGRVRPAVHLVPGNLLALQFRSPRISERLANESGTDTTDRLFHLIRTTGVNVSVEGRNHGLEQRPSELGLNESNVRALHDPRNDTVTLLVDTANVSMVARHEDSELADYRTLAYLEFGAVVEVPTDDGTRVLAGRSQFRSADDGVARSLASPGSAVRFAAEPATMRPFHHGTVTVNGTTPLLPGTSLTVRALDTDGTVLATRRVRTREPNGTGEAFGESTFSTSLAPGVFDPEGAFDVVVTRDGERIAERRVVVGEPATLSNTSARLVTSGPHEGEVAVSATMRLPDEGFLVVYVDDEPVVARVPDDRRVRRTLYVNRSAVREGEVIAFAIWDADGDGRHDPDSERLFETTADVNATKSDTELDVVIPVEGWPPGTPTATTTPPPTMTPSTASPSPTGPPPASPPLSPTLSPTAVTPTAADTSTTSVPTAVTTPGVGPAGVLLAVAVAALLWRQR